LPRRRLHRRPRFAAFVRQEQQAAVWPVLREEGDRLHLAGQERQHAHLQGRQEEQGALAQVKFYGARRCRAVCVPLMTAALFLSPALQAGCSPLWMAGEVAALYQQHGPAVYRRCYALLRDREAARDATQEVFGKLLREKEKLAGRDDVLPWI